MDSLLLSFVTAFLSSLFTLLGIYIYFYFFLKKRLQKEVEEAGYAFKKRLQESLSESAKELLPDFRMEVRNGFTEALTNALSGEIIPKTARQLAKNSQGIVEQGLSFLLGRSDTSSESEEETKK